MNRKQRLLAILTDFVEKNASVEVIQLLIERGVKIPPEAQQEVALLLLRLLKRHRFDDADFLIKLGVDLQQHLVQGHNLLMSALATHDHSILEFLLDKGADPNQGRKGVTPLETAAVAQSDKEATQLLLEHGAEPTLVHNTAERGSATSSGKSINRLIDTYSDIRRNSPQYKKLMTIKEGTADQVAILFKNLNDSGDQQVTSDIYQVAILFKNLNDSGDQQVASDIYQDLHAAGKKYNAKLPDNVDKEVKLRFLFAKKYLNEEIAAQEHVPVEKPSRTV